MERLQTITHKGKTIFRVDFSGFTMFTKNELTAVIDEAEEYIKKQPPSSILILTVVNNLKFDAEIISVFKDYTIHNKPYVKASAVVGVAGLIGIGLNSVIRTALRDIQSFDTDAQAMDWLVEQ